MQQLYRLRPDLNGQSVWFFPTLKKSAEGRLLYEKSEKRAYVYDMITQNRFSSFSAWIKALNGKRFFKGKKSALATIFLKPNCNELSVGQIIKGENHVSYFKKNEIVTLLSIKNVLVTMIYDDIELTSTNLIESEGLLCLVSCNANMKKELYIREAFHRYREPIKCSIFVNGLEVRDNTLEANGINYKISVVNEIYSIVRFFKEANVCVGQYTKGKYVIDLNNHIFV